MAELPLNLDGLSKEELLARLGQTVLQQYLLGGGNLAVWPHTQPYASQPPPASQPPLTSQVPGSAHNEVYDNAELGALLNRNTGNDDNNTDDDNDDVLEAKEPPAPTTPANREWHADESKAQLRRRMGISSTDSKKKQNSDSRRNRQRVAYACGEDLEQNWGWYKATGKSTAMIQSKPFPFSSPPSPECCN